MLSLSPVLAENIRNGKVVCQLCASPLTILNEKLFCSQSNCRQSSEEIYLINNQIPILVDFSKSILDRKNLLATAGQSLIPRSGNKFDFIKRIFWGSGRKTKNNLVEFVDHIPRPNGEKRTVLVVGGGAIGNGAAALYGRNDLDLLAFDIYASSHTDFIADGHSIPLADNSVDGVWIQAVLEHVMYPQQVVAEIHRVLKWNGIVYAETPFLQHVHEGAYDFTRFTESGHRLLFKRFERIDSGFLTGLGTVLLWNVRYMVWGITRCKKLAIAVSLLAGWIRLLDYLVPEKFNVDTASGVYFLGSKNPDHTFSDRDIISHYQGYQNR